MLKCWCVGVEKPARKINNDNDDDGGIDGK